MLFSSTEFIFIFLPLVLAVYYLLPEKARLARNAILCIASLFFYAWGEPTFVLVMMLSIVMNYLFGRMVGNGKDGVEAVKGRGKPNKAALILAVIFNIGVLFIFKYLGFFISNINEIAGTEIRDPGITLPIGISFFTFQAMSYVIDVYRGKGEAQKDILSVALYISFFPQLIAGPIVRYETIEHQIWHRVENIDDFAYGIRRFILGLGKKVIIANNMALVADQAFETLKTGTWMGEETGLPVLMAWLGAIAYTFQIFFDFSGYSDMAIGLGRMFGFRFLENFDHPYISGSVTEFWKRWHISLSTWFRDYVYIPLGGNRVSPARHILNLFVVWALTGLWHGANWTFVLWGMMYFVLLIGEKYVFSRKDAAKQKAGDDAVTQNAGAGGASVIKTAFGHIYTMFFVIMGWVIFRAESVTDAFQYMGAMFGTGEAAGAEPGMGMFYLREFAVYFVIAALASVPLIKWIQSVRSRGTGKLSSGGKAAGILEPVVLMAILVISVSFIVKGSYNPFIYFNF